MQTKPISFRTKYYVIASVAWQSPGRDTILQTHARYFCTCVEKKAHTSIRVSVIACDNVISKAQCAPHRPEGQQYKTKRFYIKSVLFRFAFRNGYA